jgi:hypothetical protein
MKSSTFLPYQDLIRKVIKFYTAQYLNPTHFEEITQYCRNHPVLLEKPNYLSFLSMGY